MDFDEFIPILQCSKYFIFVRFHYDDIEFCRLIVVSEVN